MSNIFANGISTLIVWHTCARNYMTSSHRCCEAVIEFLTQTSLQIGQYGHTMHGSYGSPMTWYSGYKMEPVGCGIAAWYRTTGMRCEMPHPPRHNPFMIQIQPKRQWWFLLLIFISIGRFWYQDNWQMNINFSDQLCVQPVSVFILFIPRIKSTFDMRVIDITLTQIENDMPVFFI